MACAQPDCRCDEPCEAYIPDDLWGTVCPGCQGKGRHTWKEGVCNHAGVATTSYFSDPVKGVAGKVDKGV